jgi:hypothetical protein
MIAMLRQDECDRKVWARSCKVGSEESCDRDGGAVGWQVDNTSLGFPPQRRGVICALRLL